MEFAPDGRLFVTEKSGAVRLIENGVLRAEPVLSLDVSQRQEMGLEGLVLDPNFAVNGYAYVYYTRFTSPVPLNRLSRFTISANDPNLFDPASETVLLDNIEGGDPGFHNGGFMRFGFDGMLYVGIGDTVKPELVQDMQTLQGKVVRLDVANFPNLIPLDNPFVGNPNARPEIYALGFRNPFTGAIDPETGRIFINDVGNISFEEINELVAGANYGWPDAEGTAGNPLYQDPVLSYAHDEIIGGSVTGSTFYHGAAFPADYHGDYFFADYTLGFIRVLDLETGLASDFAPDALTPVDLDVGPDGDLYWLSLLDGSVRHVHYAGGNRAPEAISAADATAGLSPLDVQFDSTGSHDPDGDQVTYLWDFGDGETSAEPNPAHTYAVNGTYQAVLTVSDGLRSTSALPLTIFVGDTAPVIDFTLPTIGQTYAAGDTILFGATALDRFGAPLPASAFEWSVAFHHRTHQHPFLPSISDVSSGSFVIPTGGEADAVQFYRVRVTVTNDNGISSSKFVDIQPRTSPVTLTTNFPGLSLLLDSQPIVSPHPFVGVEGALRSLAAPASQFLNGSEYVFDHWDNNGARVQTFETPATGGLTFTAIYTKLPNDAAFQTDPPALWYVGQERTFDVTLTNLSGATWLATGPTAKRIATWFGGPNENTGFDAATFTPLPANVAAGETITIPVHVTAPAVSGNYSLRQKMVSADNVIVRGAIDSDVSVSGFAATYAALPPTIWQPGETKTYAITLTNTGAGNWPATGTTPVHLGVYFGDERDEPYVWGLNEPIRYDLPREINVGDSVTLEISVTAPLTPGEYVLRHRMVREGIDWFLPQLKTTVQVGNFDALLTGTVPQNWLAGETKTYDVTLHNTGTIAWPHSGNQPYQLGLYFNGRSDVVLDWPSEPLRFNLPQDVLPGETITLSVTVTAPSQAGTYVLRQRLVQGVEWHEPLLKSSVTVLNDVGAATVSASVPPHWFGGQLRLVAVRLTNTSSGIWLATGPQAVKLGVYFDASSNAIGAWKSPPQQISLPRDLAPGTSLTVLAAIGAPAATGEHVLRLRLVAAGSHWFQPLVRSVIEVKTLRAAIAVLDSGTETWRPKETRTVRVKLTNRSDQPWLANGPERVRLIYYFDNLTKSAVSVSLPKNVAPGESLVIALPIRGPEAKGKHVLKFKLERISFETTAVLTQRAIVVR